MKIKEIPRTATFAWTQDSTSSIVTGTAAGAISADFNSSTQLELWRNGEAVFSAECDARFHDLAASADSQLVAGAMENGVVSLWKHSGDKLEAAGSGSNHTGAARAVAFNADNKLVSAGSNGEVFVWDTQSAQSTLSGAAPGSSARQDDLSGVAWNNCVKEILATAGNGGFTSIWDLRKKREVIHLHYTVAGQRLPVSSVSWHASNSTRLVTASSDDQNPVVLVWDLRNANSPEQVLEGHSAGVLSVDWCAHDPDLLLTSGKDNRTLLWNPATSSLLAEYPISVGWTFKTRFNPRAPDQFAAASFDGKVTVQTLQDTSEPTAPKTFKASGDAFWDSEEVADAVHPQFYAHQAPAWLKRPSSVSFGFGGKLVRAGSKGVSISTVRAEATDISSLKSALAGDFSGVVDRDGADWDLLKSVVEGKPLFDEETDKAEEGSAEDKADSPFDVPYTPSGPYKLFDGQNDKITKLVMQDKTAQAVDALIEANEFGDALLLASYDPALLAKARSAYLEASQKPYLRAAWAIKNQLGDFENTEIEAWSSVLKLSRSDKAKTAALGERLSKSGDRENALRVFLSGGNVAEAGQIWLQELPALEKKHSSDVTAYQARARALQEIVEKVTVASRGKPVQDAKSELYDVYRDFADIVASQGDLDVASKLLDLLPTSYGSAKERISGGKKAAAATKKYGRSPFKAGSSVPMPSSPYVIPPAVAPGVGVSAPAAAAPGAPGVGAPGAPSASPRPPTFTPTPAPARTTASPLHRSNPYAPNPYAPNPYAPSANSATAAAPVVPPVPGAVQAPTPQPIAPPPRAGSGLVSTTIKPPSHGWNDLPETQLIKNKRPAAPAIIANTHQQQPSGQAPPRRVPSSGPTPPPGVGGPSVARSNPYAPTGGAGGAPGAPSAAPGAHRVPSASASPSPYAAPSNPYAPQPQSAQSAASTPGYASAAPASVVAPAPAPRAAPPPPGKARAGPPPAATAVAANLPSTAPAPSAHDPAVLANIQASLRSVVERVRPSVEAQYPRQMKDTERRVGLLYTALPELTAPTVELLDQLSTALAARDCATARTAQNTIANDHADECGNWMTGVKRLIEMQDVME